MTRNEILDKLKNNICKVSFTKINGDKRVMPCTLREDILPAKNENKSTKKVNENVVNVWVTDINNWRSFRVDSVSEIEILEDTK